MGMGVGLHSPEGLVLKAANGGSIQYLGYMLVDVEILGHKIEQAGVLVRKGEQSSARDKAFLGLRYFTPIMATWQRLDLRKTCHVQQTSTNSKGRPAS
ncbi:hypothetical protein Hamer_G011796 [Homarus americanus]|uniref:Uncharacterized protein n=1 Tax=Homarus americanus TaxID=6706 RepID=A0A8J5JXX0_HOMAM|nr:hypothetical protein Hamer_G011796 [Homarus americanus]